MSTKSLRSNVFFRLSLTRETLMNMNKDVFAGMMLNYKERFDSTLSDISYQLKKVKELKTNFLKLETDLAVSRKINKRHIQQVNLAERKCWANEQYSRQGCPKVSGIPKSV